jgi:hypothetical protein
MKKYDINLDSLLSKGHIITETKNEMMLIVIPKRLSTNFDKENMSVNNYVYLPDTYKLPLRIDLTIKIDSPGLYLFLGNGHLNFGTPWSDNRRIDDIIEPNCKIRFFHNHIPMNEFVDISMIYDFKAMQIHINGEERYYSEKEKYMTSKLLKEFNHTGFTFKIACNKRTNLIIKSLSITEYDETAEMNHADISLPVPLKTNQAVAPDQKPQFDTCIALLPKEIKNEIIKTDEFLRSLKPMKFRRQIEKHGNKITYLASDNGFSYGLYPSNDIMYHTLGWYIITNGKPEFWHRKADMMEETLKKLAETLPEFAERMFVNLTECISCSQHCAVKTLYEFNCKKKLACHGLMEFKMCVSDFQDVRVFINSINQLLINKIV